ncbi:MAG: sulfotransferase [Novosphingobium sp.]|nr:sulfotransferase [Novosphingobium sp.]
MIDANVLMSSAKERTGLSDWGDDWYLEPMHWLVDAINKESELTEFGAGALPEMLIAHLVNQLEVHDWYKRHPEIDEEQIVTPLFGIGLPRTGSTALSHMMGLDPATRILRVWEQERHCPPPEKATELTDPRIAISAAGEEGFQTLVPEATEMLPRGVEKSQECAHVLMEAFSSGPSFELFVHVPSFNARTISPDYEPYMVRAYEYHKRVLKLLQWRCPPKRWYLKTPVHTYDIEPLLKVFPDANFVWTHREPLRSLSSVCSLIYHFRRAFVDNPNPEYLGHEHRAYWTVGLQRALDARERLGEDRFHDVYHRVQIVDPSKQVRELYAKFGWPYPPEMDARIAAWQEEHPKGKHDARPEFFGLDPEAVNEEFRFYTERFGL